MIEEEIESLLNILHEKQKKTKRVNENFFKKMFNVSVKTNMHVKTCKIMVQNYSKSKEIPMWFLDQKMLNFLKD